MQFVLIHGGLLTGHCWREVVPLVEGRATAPDLPGRGDSPASHRNICLADNARSVLAHMDALGIDNAHMVGHSLGGATILAIADSAPHRVASLVFVAAPVPVDGGTVFSAVGLDAQAFIENARIRGDVSLPPHDGDQTRATDAEPGVPEAVSPFFDDVPVRAAGNVAAVHYIRTGLDSALAPALQDQAIAEISRFAAVQVHHCQAEHMMMLTQPAELADTLNRIGRQSGGLRP